MPSIDDIIARIAAPQFGAISASQAYEAGITANAVSRCTRRGALVRVHPGVYVTAANRSSIAALRSAAVLATAPHGMLTGEAALEEWNLARYPTSSIAIVTSHRHRRLRGVELIHSKTLVDEDRCRRNGRATASVERALVDVSMHRSPQQLCQSLAGAEYRCVLDMPRLVRTVERNASRAGIGNLRAACSLFADGHRGVESSYEHQFQQLLAAAGVTGFVTNPTLQLLDRRIRPDVYFADARLIVEVDPIWHANPRKAAEDQRRDAASRAAGYDVIRVPGDQLEWGVRAVIAFLERHAAEDQARSSRVVAR